MGKMKSGYDRRDEVLGSRLREAMEDLSSKAEPGFAAIEIAAGSRDAMPASVRGVRPRPSMAFFLIPAAAALALVVGLGWSRLAGARETADAAGAGMDGMFAVSCPEAAQVDPLGTEVALLARESVGGDSSLPSEASDSSDPFHEELSAFMATLWYGPEAAAIGAGDAADEGY